MQTAIEDEILLPAAFSHITMPDLPQQPAFGLFANDPTWSNAKGTQSESTPKVMSATTAYTPPSVEQLRDAGIAKVLDNNQDWRDSFGAAAAAILARTGEVTSDAVVQVVGMPDGHPSAVGGAMRSFAVANKLSVVRYVKSTRPSCHAAIVAVWAKLGE